MSDNTPIDLSGAVEPAFDLFGETVSVWSRVSNVDDGVSETVWEGPRQERAIIRPGISDDFNKQFSGIDDIAEAELYTLGTIEFDEHIDRGEGIGYRVHAVKHDPTGLTFAALGEDSESP